MLSLTDAFANIVKDSMGQLKNSWNVMQTIWLMSMINEISRY